MKNIRTPPLSGVPRQYGRYITVAALSLMMSLVFPSARQIRAETGLSEEFFQLKKFSNSLRYFAEKYELSGKRAKTSLMPRRQTGRRMKVDGQIAMRGVAELILKDFAESYVEGFRSLDENKLDQSVRHFKKARAIWPEYFYADFIIAVLYETGEDYRGAASFYKSYLDKLKRFEEGHYKISKPIIVESAGFSITPYSVAEKLITERLKRYRIEFEDAPMPAEKGMAWFALTFALPGLLLFCVYGYLRPYFRKTARLFKYRFFPSKDSKLCPVCKEVNLNVQRECFECGHHFQD